MVQPYKVTLYSHSKAWYILTVTAPEKTSPTYLEHKNRLQNNMHSIASFIKMLHVHMYICIEKCQKAYSPKHLR